MFNLSYMVIINTKSTQSAMKKYYKLHVACTIMILDGTELQQKVHFSSKQLVITRNSLLHGKLNALTKQKESTVWLDSRHNVILSK